MNGFLSYNLTDTQRFLFYILGNSGCYQRNGRKPGTVYWSLSTYHSRVYSYDYKNVPPQDYLEEKFKWIVICSSFDKTHDTPFFGVKNSCNRV